MSISGQISRGELLRWVACGALIVSAHAACALALVQWRDAIEPFDTSGAMVVELAVTPTSAVEVERVAAPGPKQVQTDAAPPPPEKTQEKPPEERPPEQPVAEEQAERIELPVVPDAEAVLAAVPPPPLRTEPPRIEAAAVAVPMTTAPQVTASPPSTVTAAPVVGTPSPKASSAVPQWTNRISVILERTKRYPRSAQARREEGVAVVSFVLDRQGHLISSTITASSGVPALDQEALDLLARAQPFPALPPEVPGAELALSVPIRFALR